MTLRDYLITEAEYMEEIVRDLERCCDALADRGIDLHDIGLAMMALQPGDAGQRAPAARGAVAMTMAQSTLIRITVTDTPANAGVREVKIDEVVCRLIDSRKRPYGLLELWYAPRLREMAG